jgi:hypothetical protein
VFRRQNNTDSIVNVIFNAFAAVTFTLTHVEAAAQTSVDLQMTTTFGQNNSVLVSPLRTVGASYIVRNNGAFTVTGVRASSIDPRPITGLFDVVPNSNCLLQNLGSLSQPIVWDIGSLAAGESRYCFVQFRGISGAPRGNLVIGFRASAAANADPDPTNDSASIDVQYIGSDPLINVQLNATKNFQTLPPNTSGVVTVTARNSGPEASPDVYAKLQTYYFGPNFPDSIRIQPLTQTDPNCVLDQFVDACGPFGDCEVLPTMEFGPLGVGESRTCNFRVEATRYAQGRRAFEIRGAFLGFDQNPTNDNADFELI